MQGEERTERYREMSGIGVHDDSQGINKNYDTKINNNI